MKRHTLTFALLLTALTVACTGQGPMPLAPTSAAPTSGLAAKAAANISVTTVMSDVDSSGIAADLASDGLGAYSDNVGGVISILTANGYNNIKYGDWQFDTSNTAARGYQKSFDADDAVQPGDPHFTATANPPFWGTETFKAKIEVKCTFLSKSMLTMTAGSSITCPLINNFTTASGLTYSHAPAYSFTGFPETTDVQILCNSADSVGCNDWLIDPIGLGQAVGRLVFHPSRSRQPDVNDGDFYMRFHFHVTRP